MFIKKLQCNLSEKVHVPSNQRRSFKNKRKDTLKQNKKCNFCGTEFVKKSNRDQFI